MNSSFFLSLALMTTSSSASDLEKWKTTYQTLRPSLTSYICAVLLHPVARNFPSAENLTQHTTLQVSTSRLSSDSKEEISREVTAGGKGSHQKRNEIEEEEEEEEEE